jgi:large subunit ribosomal protein L25
MREMDVSCLPKDIPDHIEIDVEELSIGESIHVRDIEVPNVTILSEERRTIVVVAAPTVTVEPITEEEEGEEGVEGEEGAAEGAEGEEGATPAEGAAPAKDEKADKKRK